MKITSLKHIFAQTGDGACIIDSRQRIISWNSAAEKMLGYTTEDAVGRHCWQLLMGLDEKGEPFCKQNCQLQKEVRTGGTIESFELQLRHQNGDYIKAGVSTIPITAEPGEGEIEAVAHLWRARHHPGPSLLPLQIHLLGPLLVIRADGTIVSGALWNRVKTRALMAYLVTRKGAGVSREMLLELLWPDLRYKAALHNLNTTIYNLRRSLEPDLIKASDSKYIIFQNRHYFLNMPEKHWIDVAAFKKSIARARQARDPDTAVATYKSAIGLYRGDYLFDLVDTKAWSSGEHFRYQEMYLAAMADLANLYETMNQPAEAIDIYQKILSIDFCRENSCRRLMTLYLKQGKRAEAIKICRRLTEVLKEELDVLMSEETRKLCHQLRKPTSDTL